jgi:hypothetical protein
MVEFVAMKYGFDDADWAAGKAEIAGILSQRAKSRSMITYSDLSSQLRNIQIAPHDPAMGAILGDISTHEYLQGRGMLSVVVVHKAGDMETRKWFLRMR